jgi:uncharacterized protein YycO
MFTKLINVFLMWIGIRPDKKKKITTENNAAFLEAIKKPGTICCIGGDGFLADGIQAATNSFWCHTFCITEDGWCIEAEGEGIQHNKIDKYLGKESQMVAYQTDLTDLQLLALRLWLNNKVGKPYGYIDFLDELLPEPSKDAVITDPWYMCAALIATAYKRINIDIVAPDIKPHLATPKDVNDYCEKEFMRFKQFRFNW